MMPGLVLRSGSWILFALSQDLGFGYWIGFFWILVPLYQSINNTKVESNRLVCNRIIAVFENFVKYFNNRRTTVDLSSRSPPYFETNYKAIIFSAVLNSRTSLNRLLYDIREQNSVNYRG
jgi:hypothetical protein